ncbi:MAG: 23S rRNA (uracil(1939)-C(5))-methyltransferase RlmD [Burkholderiales bacterium]|nr:23S rRNA (uracil(1939)-C(5))-methyltransferase RlmD [Burkholderiales bacterium]
MPAARIESLAREGQGVAHVEGKVVFIEGALPGEAVEYASYRRKPAFEQARTVRVLRPSAARVEPRCPHFGVCGGCSLQHADMAMQVAAKQRVLEDALRHIGRVRPETILPAVHGPAWGYRHRARLSARYVPKKGGALVGFRERHSTYVADMRSCAVLAPPAGALIAPLRALVNSLAIAERLPQIELAVGSRATVLVFRNLVPLAGEDEAKLAAFAEAHGVQVWLQPKGPDSARPLHPAAPAALDYALPEFGVRIGFLPTDFTQVNHTVNEVMVRRALALLDPHPGERIGDLFCGLGNFTLPIAASGAAVAGYEGNEGLVRRARANAAANGIAATFATANLFEARACARLPVFEKLLVDPPREGAVEVVKALPDAGAPRRIVYVSCDPATLARDAGILANLKGYRLAAAGIVNMFPHTSHVESMALFER